MRQSIASFPERSPVLFRRAISGATLMLAALTTCFGQSATKAPAFDAASVRTNISAVNGGSINREGGRITATNFSLRDLIAFAFGIPTGRDCELSGPGWLDARNFDIVAIFPPETSRDRVREMFQTLLSQRFHLKTHNETRKLESYALVVAKKGPQLPVRSTSSDGAFVFADDHISALGFSMSDLANRLSGPVFKLDRPVVDMTGIQGVFDFTLNWAPDGMASGGRSGASIFTALQEQLGLKLVTQKLAFKIVVIDHADKDPESN